MARFDDLRKTLADARLTRATAARNLRAAKERQRKLERRVDVLSRTHSQGDPAAEARLASLRRSVETERQRAARLAAEHDRLGAAEAAAARNFTRVSDPRALLQTLDAQYPILLLPVRIETRFKQIGDGPAAASQLWVRIYPDDVAIDTFQDLLADVEVRNARAYWIQLWRAGGVEAEKKAAWRALATSHGSGRAFWIVKQFKPLNPSDEPVKTAGELILVVAAEPPLPASARAAAAAYWRAVWLAGGSVAAVEAAFDALTQATGAARAAEIRANHVPANLADRPANVGAVTVAFLDLPSAEELDTQQQPWSQAAHTGTLPERFVLAGYNGAARTIEAIGLPVPADLTVGPDPGADQAGQLRVDNGELVVPDALGWMIDFDEAVEKGMGFKIDLTPAQARAGFDQLLVLGVRLASDAAMGQAQLEELFRHHQASRKGLSIAPQGMPTNNTETEPSAYSWQEDPDASYAHYFGDTPDDPDDWLTKRDGRWLAESLGIDAEVVKESLHYYGHDQRDARAMNLALWPATIGYFMDRMMAPIFDAATIDATRSFFTRFVSGRGAVPAIRIGSQPYGILPVTAFSRMRWSDLDGVDAIGGAGFLTKLYELIKRVDQDWTALVPRVSFVGKAGDPHQILLDVIGLHPTSAEFYNRFAQSQDTVFNHLRFLDAGGAYRTGVLAGTYTQSGLDLLSRLGFTVIGPQNMPEILSKFFVSNADRLSGPLVDDRPLSEWDGVRAYRDNGDNYITWLAEAARTSHDVLRRQEGFADARPPAALLYLMLHHALDLSYLDVAVDLHVQAGVLTTAQARSARTDPRFIHVQDAGPDRGSPWQYLYTRAPAITQDPNRLVGDFVPSILAGERPYLQTQLEALDYLANVPTARLERAFIEHLDCCSYRLDAWWLGLVAARLTLMRRPSDDAEVRRGTYIGAFGWVEDLRPEDKSNRDRVLLDSSLAAAFDRPGEAPLETDRSNAGHVLAPSLNHAVTAAVLRNGYLSNATPADRETLAVDLSSRRVRLALEIVDGIRAGQTLGALLGYRFERGLHDESNVFLDDLILNLRQAFPLVANKTGATQPELEVSIEAAEARNVLDGLALIERIQTSGIRTYPFGLTGLPDVPDPARLDAVNREVERLLDVNDAVADLALAESVHQVLQGNFDRAAGTFDAFSSGSAPPVPDIAHTPRTGTPLTHRVSLHFEGGLDPADPAFASPRAKGEPAINSWLTDILPTPADIACQVEFVDRVANIVVRPTISAADLGLMPIDLLYMVTLDSEQAMGPLDDAIAHFVTMSLAPRIDSAITIRYTQPIPGKVTFFELAPLMRSLRALVLRSRPLMANDVRLPREASKADDGGAFVNEAKIAEVRHALEAELQPWATFIATMSATLSGPDEDTIIANAVADVDQRLSEFMALVRSQARFDPAVSGIGDALEWRRRQCVSVMGSLQGLIARWRGRASDSDPGFLNALTELESIRDSASSLSGLHTALAALAPTIAAHDTTPFSLAEERREVRRYLAELESRGMTIRADIATRLARVDALVADTATGASRVEHLTQAARTLLDPEFAILPEFRMATAVGAEFRNAWDHKSELTQYLENDLGKEFPVDEWLYGIARVREKLRAFEGAVMLADALSGRQLDLVPLQFPFRQPDSWLGMEYPAKVPGTDAPFTISEEKLLYSAHYASPFDETRLQCGVLVDEWTEVIPSRVETTGLAFHYDRPSTEPPQSLLLVTPTDHTGTWQWDDLVDAVRETFALARNRAVEPAHLEQTAYARFLPAIVSSVTAYPVMQSLNFSFNNEIQVRES